MINVTLGVSMLFDPLRFTLGTFQSSFDPLKHKFTSCLLHLLRGFEHALSPSGSPQTSTVQDVDLFRVAPCSVPLPEAEKHVDL